MKKIIILLIFLLSGILANGQMDVRPTPTDPVTFLQVPRYSFWYNKVDTTLWANLLNNPQIPEWIKLLGANRQWWTQIEKIIAGDTTFNRVHNRDTVNMTIYKLKDDSLKLYRLLADTTRLKGTATIFDLQSYTVKNDSSKYYEKLVNKTLNVTTDGASDIKYPSAKAVKTFGDLKYDGSGAVGQVAFHTAARTLSGDNGLFWDNTNKRLGIGVTPGAKVDIMGDNNQLFINTIGTYSSIYFKNTNVVHAALFTGGENFSIQNRGTGYLSFNGGGLSSDDMIIFNNGHFHVGYSTDQGYTAAFNGTGYFSGNLTTNAFIKIGGTSAQYLLADGSVTTSSGAVYKGEVDGDDGVPLAGGTALADGTGTAGWYYACYDAGTFNYDAAHTGHPITLAIGDQIYYNGTIWLKIPGAGSYTLPIATASLGGVVTNENVSVNASTGVMTVLTNANLTGGITSSGNATTVVTNANLTGPITSVGNTTSIASQTGTGTTFVTSVSPTLTNGLTIQAINTVGNQWINFITNYSPGYSYGTLKTGASAINLDLTGSGNFTITNGMITMPALKVTTGAGLNKVLLSDADGLLSYSASALGASAFHTDSYFQLALTNPITGTGASGQVVFWNGTTTQTGDNGLFWDNTNKRLGIGVTPGAKVDIMGDNNQLFINTIGTYSSIYFKNTNVVYAALFTGGENFSIQNRGTGYLSFNGGGLSSDDMIILDNGTVLIGYTVNPASYKAAINGTFYTNGVISTVATGTSTDWNEAHANQFPGFGTSHSLAAYGDHNHSGVYLTSETDPNVSAWAKAATKPSYTYSEVGAQIAGTYSTDIHANITALNAVSGTNTGNQDLSGLVPYTGASGNVNLGAYTVTAGDFCRTASDSTLKRNIKPFELSDFSKASKIDFKKYMLKADTTDRQHYGAMAQTVEKIFPEMVYTDLKTGKKTVSYEELLIVKFAAMEEEIRLLKEQIKLLKNEK